MPRQRDLGAPAGLPDHLRQVVEACARAHLPANVALVHLAMQAQAAAEVDQALAEAAQSLQAVGDHEGARNIIAAEGLWRQTPQAFATIKAMCNAAPHDGARFDTGDWAGLFDRLAMLSPAASVALYSLGRQDLLDAATASICRKIHGWGLLAPDATVLDFGCGSGRMLREIAPYVRWTVGLDISAIMLRVAREACSDLANVALLQASGSDLHLFRSKTFDLICAIDVFPYLHATTGTLVADTLRDAHRILKPGGSLLILNYSYRGDPAADCDDLRRHAAGDAWSIVRLGSRDFAYWDGATFHLRRDPEMS